MSPRAASPDESDPEPMPLSALQHAVYCLRQAALIHLERMWAENVATAEGHVLYVATDRGEIRVAWGVRRVHALPLSSRRLNLDGVADLVEFVPDGSAHPVEYKRGKPKPHRADEVQLCAQGLCLEEMTGRPVAEGALFYATTKRRLEVALDAELRRLTEDAAASLRGTLASGITPPPTAQKNRCRACSLRELCRPDAVRRGARAWRTRTLGALLDETS